MHDFLGKLINFTHHFQNTFETTAIELKKKEKGDE